LRRCRTIGKIGDDDPFGVGSSRNSSASAGEMFATVAPWNGERSGQDDFVARGVSGAVLQRHRSDDVLPWRDHADLRRAAERRVAKR
jgi:hypothetical protein